MDLTPEQRALLREVILGDRSLDDARAAADKGGDVQIAAWLNEEVRGEALWRGRLTVAECNDAIQWTEFLGLSLEMMAAWAAMTAPGYIVPTSDNVRDALGKIFGSAPGTRDALLAAARRPPTRLELLLAKAAGDAKVSAVTDATITAAAVSVLLRG
jgi:hypothetical protein